MNQSDIYKELYKSIIEMALKKSEIVDNPSSTDYAIQLAASIKDMAGALINSTYQNKSALDKKFISELFKQIQDEKQEKLNILEAGFNKKIKIICAYIQKLNDLVVGKHILQSRKEIDSLLDELSPSITERDDILKIIEKIRNSHSGKH